MSQWEVKALVKDFEHKKNESVAIDIIGYEPDHVKAHIRAPIGMSLASFAMNGKKITYTIDKQKKYVISSIKPDSLVPLIQVPLDPRLLMMVIFENEKLVSGFKCNKKDDVLDSCVSEDKEIKLKWSDRNGFKRRVTIQHEDFEIQLLFKDYKTLVQQDGSFWEIPHPKGFDTIEIK